VQEVTSIVTLSSGEKRWSGWTENVDVHEGKESDKRLNGGEEREEWRAEKTDGRNLWGRISCIVKKERKRTRNHPKKEDGCKKMRGEVLKN